MKTLFNTYIFCGALAIANASSAQNLQCPDLAKTIKEYSIDSSSSSFLNAVFTQHCQQDGSRKSSGGGFGLDAIIKAVPIKFTGNYASSDEAMTSFCKTYASQTTGAAASDSYRETISLKALETIQQCNALQASGVLITHKVENIELAHFYLKNSVTQTLELQGVAITGDVSCEGLINGKKKAFDASLGLDVKSTVGFACKRTARQQGQLVAFSESIITVLTNQGNYSVFWPRDSRLSPDLATEIDRRITVTEGEIALTKVGLAPFITSAALSVYQCPTGTIVGYNAAWMYVGCNGQLSAEKTCENVWYVGKNNAPREVRQCQAIGNIRLLK